MSLATRKRRARERIVVEPLHHEYRAIVFKETGVGATTLGGTFEQICRGLEKRFQRARVRRVGRNYEVLVGGQVRARLEVTVRRKIERGHG